MNLDMQKVFVADKLAAWFCACLLSIDAVHTMCQAKLLEHEVTARLKQLANDAVWLLQISLNQQNTPTSL